MSPHPRSARPFAPPLLAALLASLVPLPAAGQIAGDRQLLSTTGGGDPYVMILFDTSGSMNWATACDQEDRDAGRCNHDCAAPNCPQELHGDDPDSKIYQAKQALYNVMVDHVGPGRVRWGFASLNQDELVVSAKHWLYEVESIAQISGSATPAFPAVGWQEVFGIQSGGSGAAAYNYGCDRWNPGTDDNNAELYETGCYMNSSDAPKTDATDAWTLGKLQRIVKGGEFGQASTRYYLRNAGNGNQPYYRVTYGASGSQIEYPSTDSFTVLVTIEQCDSNDVVDDLSGLPRSCGTADDADASSAWVPVSVREVTYAKVSSFLHWEGSPSNTPTGNTQYSKDAYLGGRTDGEPVSLSGVAWATDIYADKTCRGWEPSGVYPGQTADITEVDPYSATSYNLRFPTTSATYDPTGSEDDWIFQYGDIIPLRWDDMDDDVDDNYYAVLRRLNPKYPTEDDDAFAQSPYFADSYEAGENFLRLKTDDDSATEDVDEAIRPLVSAGSTPLAGWFSMFRRWYSGCGDPGNCDDENTGWQDIAAQFDPDFNCTKKYVLMITDGAETCDGSVQENSEDYYEENIEEFPDGFSKTADQCRYRASLRAQEGIESIVIGFGVENKEKLQCANTNVYFADNAGELEELLEDLILEILESAASFASAAVPTVQANILDKVYLSSFIPLNDEAIWPGRLDAFLKPLPLDESNLPDREAECAVGQQSECFAWDAGDSQPAFDDDPGNYDPDALLDQAPVAADIVREFTEAGNASLKIGTDATERRVFFGRPDDTDLGKRRYFRYPEGSDSAADDEWLDYELVWNISFVDTDPTDTPLSAARKDAIADIIEFTLQEKQAIIDRVCTAGARIGETCSTNADCDTALGAGDGLCTDNGEIQFVMGDIFHSNPIVVNPPADFELYTKDLYWNTPLCGDATVETTRARGPQISYSWFSNKNLCRRIMMGVGSNDGQFHMFDAGIMRDITPDDPSTSDEDERVAADCLINAPTNSSSYEADLYDADGAEGNFDFGTGRELFSFIPAAMMPHIQDLSTLTELTTEYGVDGTARVADVFIDPVVPGGAVTCTERAWRTVLLGTYREGGAGIFALDITQPDTFDSENRPEPLAGTPSYVPSCTDGGGGCDEFCAPGDTDCAAQPFPALLWEFRDLNESGVPADDDANDVTDLAESWSRPLVVRHPVCYGACDLAGEPEDRWLAIFGGGLPEMPTNDANETAGNWLYMVDIETGETLYKRGGLGGATSSPIEGAVPSDITGVDDDNDGIIDTLYFGTTAGFVYKVDLGDAAWELGEDATDPATYGKLIDPDDDPGRYDPFKVFTTDGKPIYQEINAVYVPRLRRNAILFGTGIRWNLWIDLNIQGRFYALVDDLWADADRNGEADEACAGCPVPLDESVYFGLDPDDTVTATANFLYGAAADTQPGWYFRLDANETLITEPFTLSGVTFFTIFDPLIVENSDGFCSKGGESKIFIVNAVTTVGYAIQAGATERTRYIIAPTFTTQPYIESSATKNAPTSSSEANSDTWTTELREINSDLRKLFPSGARFANYTLDIKTIRKDTGIVFIAPVPVAIEPHNWKEF